MYAIPERFRIGRDRRVTVYGTVYGRDKAAKAFLDGKDFRQGSIFVQGSRIYSYGHHYVIAERVTEPDSPRFHYGVNEAKWSVTTSRHTSAVTNALRYAGWEPTNETYRGDNGRGHIMRVWKPAQ